MISNLIKPPKTNYYIVNRAEGIIQSQIVKTLTAEQEARERLKANYEKAAQCQGLE